MVSEPFLAVCSHGIRTAHKPCQSGLTQVAVIKVRPPVGAVRAVMPSCGPQGRTLVET